MQRRFPLDGGNDSDKRVEGRGYSFASPSCIPLQTRLITTDAGTESGRTFPCIFFQNPAALSSHFPRIPFRIPQAFLKTFYYFSHHDQNASYRASL